MRATLLALLLAFAPGAPAAGWIAFVVPDIPRGRFLYEEFARLVAKDLEAHGLELRFVPVADVPDGPGVEEPVVRAIAGRPAMILAGNEQAAVYAKRHTSTIPVLFGSASHPVRGGLVESMARPGRNLTGFTFDVEIERKQLELLKEIAPKARVVGVLNDGTWYPKRVPEEQVARLEQELGVKLRILTGRDTTDMGRLVQSPEGRAVDAWLVPVHNLTGSAPAGVVKAVNGSRKPAVYGRTFFVEAGGLASYQEVIDQPMAIWAEMFRMILRGVPPGEIPVRRPKDFVLAVNLDEARRSGITLRSPLLRRADKVIGGSAR